MRTKVVLCAAAFAMLMGGCPLGSSNNGGAVKAVITISSTHGEPPLLVTVSAAASTSTSAGDLKYAWDFGDQTTADTVTASHTFTHPGLFTVILRVTDSKNQSDTTSVDVQLAGAAPTAVIVASTSSGPTPLQVHFDASGSSAPDDTIHDYRWEFGDNSDPNGEVAPFHTFTTAGTYTVTLTVTTGGGVSASTTTTITVGSASQSSLQFDGTQFATLPVSDGAGLIAWTFEAWFKSSAAGGVLANLGDGAVLIEVLPTTNLIQIQIGSQTQTVTDTSLTGLWKHVALAVDATSAVLYVNGMPVKTAAGSSAIDVSSIVVGNAYAGKAAQVRFWDIARTAADIAGDYNARLTVKPAALLGYWPFDEGAGQTLTNRAASGSPGTRGATTAAEATDPAWSTDAPNLK